MLTDKRFISSTPERWGGIECSFTRVGSQFLDQLQITGHDRRGSSDIDRFAALGFKSMRYPFLWEKHQLRYDHPINWQWASGQLDALQRYNIEPIAGLLHHGNGPPFTDLLDPDFPEHFVRYARAFAEKFPWVKYYTPINEPLTTARFCGLYGLWYPHKKNDRDFAIIFLNQMKATILAMESTKGINPEAQLVQTEDLSKTYSTPLLKYQADFENERRWLTYDTLCGRFNRHHILWPFFEQLDLPHGLLLFFEDHYCPPEIVGADHYLTSERFLDERLDQYPHHHRGGNHQHEYADVEAIRVKHDHPWGLKVLLKECWERFHIPMAITEVHVNGSSQDQIRWFRQVEDQADELITEGIPIAAVTAWSLLGSFGWNDLLTRNDGVYEAGAFDIRAGQPALTEFGIYLKRSQSQDELWHPALAMKGWWQEPDRCFYNVDPACKDVDLVAPPLEKRAI